MSEILLVRQPGAIPDDKRDAAREVLFGVVDGLGDLGKKQWRRFFNSLMRLEPGEVVKVTTKKPRSGPFHRRHMVIETRVFDAQERFEQFDQFRNWLKVGAGYCDWIPGPRGAVMPVPKSIAYDELEDGDFRQVHDDMIAFLRSEHAGKVLWPKATPAQRSECIELVLSEFNE